MSTLPASPASFPVERYRADFPVLATSVRGKPLTYFDNAATSQMPSVVIQRLAQFHGQERANVHRGVHYLSQVATEAYEASRGEVQRFLNARSEQEIIFVRGTTEAINLVAQSFARPRLKPGDEIVISTMEHHSNIVPWQMVCEQTGAHLRIIPISDAGELDMAAIPALLSERTRLLSVVHVSNSLGTINPVRELVALAHARGIPVLFDGAQALPHLTVDVQALDCDFYCFSGHKVFGPTGIGALYGKAALLDAMPPYQGGGDMIRSVTFARTTYNDLPYKFEAGTPNIAGAVGLGTALAYLRAATAAGAAEYEAGLLAYATAQVAAIPGLRLIGTAAHKASVLSFVMDGIHPHDIGTVLDMDGIAIRAGHHCTQPLMQRLGLAATARASFAFYNTRAEIDRLITALAQVRKLFT